MAETQVDFTDVSHSPPPPQAAQQAPVAARSSRAAKYQANSNDEETSCFQKPKNKWLIIGIVVALVVIIIVLAIVLPVVLTRKTSSTVTSSSTPQTVTTVTTTTTTQPYITKCRSTMAKNFIKALDLPSVNDERPKPKMAPAPEQIGESTRVERAYLVEFAIDAPAQNQFRTITKSLETSHDISPSDVQIRRSIQSPLFSGTSFTVNKDHPIEAIENIKGAVAIYPIYTIPPPKPIKTFGFNELYTTGNETINSYSLTGISQIHSIYKNFGAGVRVAVIDTGVYYLHPALGGCFGPGCKVAFGYDFTGDEYGSTSEVMIPDGDPLDNCSSSSHGTHVAGIIAANSTGISDSYFSSYVPFIGVAPQATLGAYRVFGCNSGAPTDAIVEAIYRAYNDKVDVINLSLGGPGPYATSAEAMAVKRVTDAGVYVVIAAGNSGDGGMQTTGDPSNSPAAMSIGSVDNAYSLSLQSLIIVGPNNTKILYRPGTSYGAWRSIVNSTIVVNDPTRPDSDGCSGPSKSVLGAVVLFFYKITDQCGSTARCNLAAIQGAVGCLLYNATNIIGASTIPSGSISVSDGLAIVARVSANPSSTYTFTNWPDPTSVDTAGIVSSFSSLGPTGDLFLKPQICGIGGKVYSTMSPYAANMEGSTRAYAFMSGTSMASPYVAGTLALFLASLGNPSPSTASGVSSNGICRPPFPMAANILQSTAKTVNNYRSTLLSNAIQQGSGLVDIYHAITATTMISPSELSLNDTVRKAASYTIKVFNIGTKTATYNITHVGAALATGKTLFLDQLLLAPQYSGEYGTVSIDPSTFNLEPEQSRNITLRFTPPSVQNPALLPIYSGFIYITNQVNGDVVHLPYAGMVGNFSDARIIVRQDLDDPKTGLLDLNGNYIADTAQPSFNTSTGAPFRSVLAWSTRLYVIDAISVNTTGAYGYTPSLGILVNGTSMFLYSTNTERQTAIDTQTFQSQNNFLWQGTVCANTTSCINGEYSQVPTGRYRIRFSALKSFGNISNPNDYDVYLSPAFSLTNI